VPARPAARTALPFCAGAIGRLAVRAGFAVLVLAGCAGGREGVGEGADYWERADTLEAPLRPVGGTVATGAVRVAQTVGGTLLSVNLFNVAQGRYRVALHVTPVCNSPNGSSAGPPWVPPGASGPVVIEFSVDSDGRGFVARRLAGVALTGPTGVNGRSAVIHEGYAGPLEAESGVPNNRVACGVFGAVLRYF
jgi:Cu/Zn superoxide dismutase